MIKLGKGRDPIALHFRIKTIVAPAACLVVLAGALAISLDEPQTLIAESATPQNDLDSDGLVYQQEYLLGTNDLSSDSDQDGFSDLEELARGSNPTLFNSKPNSNPLGTRVMAYSGAGVLTFQTVAFVKNSDIADLSLEAGIVGKRGQSLTFGPDVINMATFVTKQTKNPADMIVVMTLPIPDCFVTNAGQLNLFARLQDVGPQQRPSAVTTMSVVESDGILFELQDSPVTINEGDGIIYRPLTGPDDPAPASSVTGQVCWQNIAPVGSNGSLLEFQVQASSCQDFDAFCSSSGCSSSFGGSVSLIDPGSLIGG